MQYSINSSDSELLSISLSGEIDHHTTVDIRRGIDAEVERYRPRRLILDFSAVTFMDSSGIGVIIGRYKKIAHEKGKVSVININPRVKKVFDLSGMNKIINVYSTYEEALSSL